MSRDQSRNSQLFSKAMEIVETVKGLDNLVPEENEYLKDIVRSMRADALEIPAKISGAEAMDLYDLKMENAAIIRKNARDIYLSCNGFLMEDFKETEYLDLLRREIEEFRLLFAEWVKTFDPWNYVIDRWGLFNPPGVNYDDKDPDDDIPFDFDDSED